MTEEQVDWAKEYDKCATSGEYWKPPIGKSKVTFLDSGKIVTGEYEGKELEQLETKIKITNALGQTEEKTWTITKGGKSSLYGQIALCAKDNGGLAGLGITLKRTGTGKETRYIIPQALALEE